ncbi:hypothetical protein [Bradyrhizobium sp. USDA 3650]
MVTIATLGGSSVMAAGGGSQAAGAVKQERSNVVNHVFIVRQPFPIQGGPAPPVAPVGVADPSSKINSRIDSKIYSRF